MCNKEQSKEEPNVVFLSTIDSTFRVQQALHMCSLQSSPYDHDNKYIHIYKQ